MTIRFFSIITQAEIGPGRPIGNARLFNLAMMAILIVGLAALVSSVIIFAYVAEWHESTPINGLVEPNVQLSSAEAWGGGDWGVEIAGVSESRELDYFMAVLLKDGVLQDIMNLTDGFSSDMVFFDLGGEGDLTSGDFFVITCDPGSSYELSIIWKPSGNQRGSVHWET